MVWGTSCNDHSRQGIGATTMITCTFTTAAHLFFMLEPFSKGGKFVSNIFLWILHFLSNVHNRCLFYVCGPSAQETKIHAPFCAERFTRMWNPKCPSIGWIASWSSKACVLCTWHVLSKVPGKKMPCQHLLSFCNDFCHALSLFVVMSGMPTCKCFVVSASGGEILWTDACVWSRNFTKANHASDRMSESISLTTTARRWTMCLSDWKQCTLDFWPQNWKTIVAWKEIKFWWNQEKNVWCNCAKCKLEFSSQFFCATQNHFIFSKICLPQQSLSSTRHHVDKLLASCTAFHQCQLCVALVFSSSALKWFRVSSSFLFCANFCFLLMPSRPTKLSLSLTRLSWNCTFCGANVAGSHSFFNKQLFVLIHRVLCAVDTFHHPCLCCLETMWVNLVNHVFVPSCVWHCHFWMHHKCLFEVTHFFFKDLFPIMCVRWCSPG